VPAGLGGEDSELGARIIALANQVEIFHRSDRREETQAMVRRRSAGWFDPAAARAFAMMSEEELGYYRALPTWPARVAAAHTIPREFRAPLDGAFDPAQASTITVPTLMPSGSDSPDYTRAATESVAAALADARITVLDGQQHVARTSSFPSCSPSTSLLSCANGHEGGTMEHGQQRHPLRRLHCPRRSSA
jgi:pimeloyl-ACP methyl ester carboxylesterase